MFHEWITESFTDNKNGRQENFSIYPEIKVKLNKMSNEN